MAIIKYIFFYLFCLDFVIEVPYIAVFSSLFSSVPQFHNLFAVSHILYLKRLIKKNPAFANK